MKKIKFAGIVVVFLMALMMSTMLLAQNDKSKRPSPPAQAKGKIGKAQISIDYSSPSVKGRKIWGDKVPYGKIWRAGANEATIFETDKDITVEGKSLKAGKYSLFASPGETEWEFIFNSEVGQWGVKKGGDANLDPTKNVLTVKVKPSKSASVNEKLLYTITASGFTLQWDNVEVPVGIK